MHHVYKNSACLYAEGNHQIGTERNGVNRTNATVYWLLIPFFIYVCECLWESKR